MSSRRILECLVAVACLAGLVFFAHGWACIGPFPNRLLMGGDPGLSPGQALAVLAPPVADFRREIERIRLPVVPPFRSLPPSEEGLAAEVSVPVPVIIGQSPAGHFGEGPGAAEPEGSMAQSPGGPGEGAVSAPGHAEVQSGYIPLKQYLSRQTIEVDRWDLQAALQEMNLPEKQRETLLAQHQALRESLQSSTLATHPTAQQVITAYLIARGGPTPSLPMAPSTPLVKAWLNAVEANRVTDLEGAERLAWAAYQAGEMEMARRWLDRAPPDEAMALWLRAKLLLHDGRIDQAASLLARVARLFPPEERWRDLPPWNPYWEELTPSKREREEYWPDNPYWWGEVSPSHQALGELGVLQLARRAYLEALDALLRAGFWLDAAYVAERVLTPEELVAYVDRHWPQAMLPQRPSGAEREGSTAPSPGEPEEGGVYEVAPWDLLFNGWAVPENLAIKIRYLLARRLARLGRWKEARNYYPPALQPGFDVYVGAMRVRQDRRLPARRRAKALWEAANIARREGMELLGTEVEPDWRVFSGGFALEAASFVRGFPEDAPLRMKIVQASPDERARLRRHLPPQKRFHYRYTAAILAWEAARLMPGQSEATAEVLCIAGSWLKNRDPQAADRFYKALVKRCGRTELGRKADRLRWFPWGCEPSG